MSGDIRCQAIRPLLTQEELTEREREELGSHLADCEACRRARDEHRAVWSMLAAASTGEAATMPTDAEFLATLHRRRLRLPPPPPRGGAGLPPPPPRGGAGLPPPSPPRGRWRFLSPAGRWVAAAAAVVVAATAFLCLAPPKGGWFRSGSEDQAIIENLTVLEDLQAVQAGSGTEFTEVSRELLSLLDEEAEAADQ